MLIVNVVLPMLSLTGVLALLVAALLLTPKGFGLQNLLIPTFRDVAWDLALAAAIVALVATAQRRQWGWFAGIVLAALLGALAPVVSAVMLVYGIAPLALHDCGVGVACNSLPDVAGVLRALVPLIVLLYSFHPIYKHRSDPL